MTYAEFIRTLEPEARAAWQEREAQAEARICEPAFAAYREAAVAVAEIPPAQLSEAAGTVCFQLPDSVSAAQQSQLATALQAFRPWKKGPFKIGDTTIDAEWQSQWKWERIKPVVGNLQGKRVCDIGCHNGYYMFRMLTEDPTFVLGLEPVAKHVHCLRMLADLAGGLPSLHVAPLGAEDIDLCAQSFDTVFCLGILYHQTDPITALRKIHRSLVTGGEVIIDCQGIPGEEAQTLTPAGRYAGASGIWWLPTAAALHHWLHRTGFRDIACFYSAPLSTQEQRSTDWAPIPSLADQLNPENHAETKEGYPAPWRHYLRARR